ncbi:hypothetical protein KGM_206103 [Danaus plexippus plexippus]|uniref:Uncharacterized protein n=1 Tax=Danaus plexippus plexippus TaxID=278856 RepID=A0A212EU48_DANPL|nr:hypothetical protein KGM_206103 [Danaus plexippus plexippus]
MPTLRSSRYTIQYYQKHTVTALHLQHSTDSTNGADNTRERNDIATRRITHDRDGGRSETDRSASGCCARALRPLGPFPPRRDAFPALALAYWTSTG